MDTARNYAVIFLVCLQVTTLAKSQDPASVEEKGNEVHEWADDVAASLEVYLGDERCDLQEGSLLRWTNPIAGEVFGDCYLWTFQNRPTAFMSVYAFYTPATKRRITLQSLSERTLRAVRNSTVVWQPTSPGLAWADMGTLPAPGPNSAVRQRQMRGIAAQCSAQIAHKDEADSFRKLRLLTQPLYKYRCVDQNLHDGAMFAFVDGTDPEVLLLVECTGISKLQYRVAPIRQNHRALKLSYNDNPVWEAEALAPPFPNPRISSPSGTYYNTEWRRIQNMSDETP